LNGEILLYEDDPQPKNEPLVVKVHSAPVNQIKFNEKYGVVISADINGFIEYWDPNTLDIPKDSSKVGFKSKFQTDLFDMVNSKTYALSITISPTGKYWSMVTKDRKILLFDFKKAKAIRKLNYNLDNISEMQNILLDDIKEGSVDFR